jgi:hypothetical protein
MDRIDEVLLTWYAWTNDYTPKLGYGSCDPACRSFRSTRQWMTLDELGDEVDATMRALIGAAVEPLVGELGLRERVAVNVAMRNQQAGAIVWRNPRWPETQEEDYNRAKTQIEPKLRAAGLLDNP